MNSICPFYVQQVNIDVFLTYLLSVKRSNNKYFSFSCYDGKRSAFMHLMAQSDQIQDESDKKAMSKMMKGLRKTFAKTTSENDQRAIEGKEYMSFKCYQQTYKLLIEPDSVFAFYFLTIQWNLISRSDAAENILFKQVKWESDHLKIYFRKHKSDQIGLKKDKARHVSSNLNNYLSTTL